MSEHLTQGTIYAYLDGELPAAELGAVQAHLAKCGECTLRLQQATALFKQLEDLPEEPVVDDLAPGVLERLEPATGWLPRLALGELLAALSVGTALLIGLGSATVSGRLIEAGRQTVRGLEAAVETAGAALAGAIPDPGSLQLDLGASAIWTLAAGALALWALGNGLVLRRVARGRQS